MPPDRSAPPKFFCVRKAINYSFRGSLDASFPLNGDMIVTAYDTDVPVNAIADETKEPDPRNGGGRDVGPTNTAMIDLRSGDAKTDLVIQDWPYLGLSGACSKKPPPPRTCLTGWPMAIAEPTTAAVRATMQPLTVTLCGNPSCWR